MRLTLSFTVFFFGVSLLGQVKQPTSQNAAPSSEQMSTGVLAILADLPGSLVIDGVEGGKPTPGNVLALKLVAGQHFVEFRNGNGQKVWDKVVTIPAGSQIAERISLQSQTQTPTATATNGPSTPPPAPILTSPATQPVPSSTQLYQTVNVQDLVNLLKAGGYDTQIDSDGDIRYKINNINTWIHLYGCDDTHQCKSFAYRVGFNNKDAPSVELMNEYNLKKRWAHVYLNQAGGPAMDWDIPVEGGVSYQYLARTLSSWRDLLMSFLNSIVKKTVQ